MARMALSDLFPTELPIIGMVHLRPLPGSPRFLDLDDVLESAGRDARTLARGGVDGIMVENFGDAPFFPATVPPETVAGITRAVLEVRRATTLPLGVNVLRNDARAALGIAAVTGAAFVRVNVHVGALLTDQGWIDGRAHETLRARRALAAPVAILADVLVKHATPPAGLTVESAARDTWERGGADALIVSGAATGDSVDPQRLRAVRAAVPAPLLIGSGLTADNAAALLRFADGAIVGSAFQQDGRAGAPVVLERVQAIIEAVRAARRERSH